MRLEVKDSDGQLVAQVHADPDCPFCQQPGQPPGFVMGTFEPGPAFDYIRHQLEEVDQAFERGEHDRVLDIQDQMELLGLVAADPSGREYPLQNICFKAPGLLFMCIFK